MGNTKHRCISIQRPNVINVILNFFLIYPTRPASVLGRTVTIPGAGLGAAGAATASAIALTFAGVAMLAAGVRQGRFRIALRECRRPDGPIIRQAVYLGVPTAIERATINLGQIAMTALVASLGTVSLAAHQIATTAEGVCYLPPTASPMPPWRWWASPWAPAAGRRPEPYGRLAGWLGFWMCLATGAALFVFAPQLAALFNTDPLVVAEATVMLRIVAFARAAVRRVHHPLRRPAGRPGRALSHGGGTGGHVGPAGPAGLRPGLLGQAGAGRRLDRHDH